MANIFVVKPLAQGQLPSSKGTLYTVPAFTTGYVKFLSLANTSATNTETCIIYAKTSGGSSRIIGRVVLAPNETARIIEINEAVNIDAGGLIEGSATDATTVDFYISGAEES